MDFQEKPNHMAFAGASVLLAPIFYVYYSCSFARDEKGFLKMEMSEIWGYILTAVGSGGITQIVNWRINKRKAKAEVQQSEIEVIAATVRTVYEPIIKQQNDRIAELDKEVKDLRAEKRRMQEEYEKQIQGLREEHNKQISALEKRMLEVSRAVGLRTATQTRAANGQFTSSNKG